MQTANLKLGISGVFFVWLFVVALTNFFWPAKDEKNTDRNDRIELCAVCSCNPQLHQIHLLI